jgi:dockerin type I repeat protein
MVTRFVTYACVIAMTAATVVVVQPVAQTRGDTNQDGRIDVLDIQTVVAEVLAGATPEGLSDVNADGRVDVRDFQLTLGESKQAPEESDLPEETDADSYVAYVPVRTLAFAHPELRRIDVLTVLHTQDDEQPSLLPTCDEFLPPQTERYLYRLTPHAPPTCA